MIRKGILLLILLFTLGKTTQYAFPCQLISLQQNFLSSNNIHAAHIEKQQPNIVRAIEKSFEERLTGIPLPQVRCSILFLFLMTIPLTLIAHIKTGSVIAGSSLPAVRLCTRLCTFRI